MPFKTAKERRAIARRAVLTRQIREALPTELAKLVGTYTRLEKASGDIAKRRARENALAALRAVRAAIDRDFPVAKRKPARRRKKRTPAKRIADLLSAGWEGCPSFRVQARLANLGIKTKTIDHHTLAPSWAVTLARVDASDALIRKCKKSPNARKAAVTRAELKAAE